MKKVIVLFFTCILTLTIVAQDQNNEISSKVEELTSYHNVIYKLWHTAWPKKDVKMLQELLPDIEKGAHKIVSAKLPGILREKKERWDKGVDELLKSVEDYKTAIAIRDSLTLLATAETLHSKYEGLVRIIRPVIKEVDQFHQELYMLYHYYLPDNNHDKINLSAKVLEQKVGELKLAKLPERLASKKDKFTESVLALETTIIKLNEALIKKEREGIKAAVNSVHTQYQGIEKIFE